MKLTQPDFIKQDNLPIENLPPDIIKEDNLPIRNPR